MIQDREREQWRMETRQFLVESDYKEQRANTKRQMDEAVGRLERMVEELKQHGEKFDERDVYEAERFEEFKRTLDRETRSVMGRVDEQAYRFTRAHARMFPEYR